MIVHLPIWDVRSLERRPAFHESIYMVYSTLHWKPMVNGYAGIEPREYTRIRAKMMEFPSEEFLDMLRDVGVRYIVVHRGGYGVNQWRRYQEQMAELRPGSLREVVSLEGDTVFELLPGMEPESAAEAARSRRASGASERGSCQGRSHSEEPFPGRATRNPPVPSWAPKGGNSGFLGPRPRTRPSE